MKAGIARHPAEREVHLSVCQRASGSWYAGFSVALDQGIVGETQLFHRQANRPRVQAVKPYHTIPYPPPQRVEIIFENSHIKINYIKDVGSGGRG